MQDVFSWTLLSEKLVVPREENDWVLLPHNETLTASRMQDKPEKLFSLPSNSFSLLFSLSRLLSLPLPAMACF